MRAVMDIKLWIVLGIILGFVIGFDHPDAPMMLIITLMIQMTLALQGLKFNLSDLKDNRKEAFICLLFCFGLNTAVTCSASPTTTPSTSATAAWRIRCAPSQTPVSSTPEWV